MTKAAIISIGDELLSGLTVDTNLTWLAERLIGMGIHLAAGFTVGDDITAITQALERASVDADIILITGGLGPTDDDLTRQALAQFLGVELDFHQRLMDNIADFFARRELAMSPNNRTQAYIPHGAVALDNNTGTAPGILAEHKGRLYISMPGVPAEMKPMFEDAVLPRIQPLATSDVILTKRIRCFGAGESVITQKLGNLMQRHRNPLIDCTVDDCIVTLRIIARASSKQAAQSMIEKDQQHLAAILGSLIFGFDQQTLPEVVAAELKRHRKTLAVAESCTGGLLAKLITDLPGASEYFICGWVAYSNNAKKNELSVPSDIIERYGTVSQQVACALASAARTKASADYGLGITGIAGPSGGSEQKPTGLVYIAADLEGTVVCRRHIFLSSRRRVRLSAALTALDLLRHGMID